MKRLLIWCFICYWNCIGKEINVNNIKAFTIVLILNFMFGIWCDLFLKIQILILGMLILAIKESLHFLHTHKNYNLLCCLWHSHQMVFPHPSIIRFSHFYLQSLFYQDHFISFQPCNSICKVFVRIVSLFHGLRNYGDNFSLLYSSLKP